MRRTEQWAWSEAQMPAGSSAAGLLSLCQRTGGCPVAWAGMCHGWGRSREGVLVSPPPCRAPPGAGKGPHGSISQTGSLSTRSHAAGELLCGPVALLVAR